MKYYALVGIVFLALSFSIIPVHAQIFGPSLYYIKHDPLSYWLPLNSTAATQLTTDNLSNPPNVLPPNINLPQDICLCINPANVAGNIIEIPTATGAMLHAADVSAGMNQQKPYSDINSTVPAQFAGSPNVPPGNFSTGQMKTVDQELTDMLLSMSSSF